MSDASDSGSAEAAGTGGPAQGATKRWLMYGIGPAIGVGAGGGAGVGAIFGNPGVGAAVGAAIGVVVGASMSRMGRGRSAC